MEVTKMVPVEEAVGTMLLHDITRIVPGLTKGPVFRKGHIVREEDIPILLGVGKENLYVGDLAAGMLHENDAALRIARAVAGKNLLFSEVKEGRINFHASRQGLLKIDLDGLMTVNTRQQIALATLHGLQEVKKGQAVGGTRIIPLCIKEEIIEELEKALRNPVIDVLPFRSFKVGVVTTGSEIYRGRIKDAFGPVLSEKFKNLGSAVVGQKFTDDKVEITSSGIMEFVDAGVDMVVCTGGMSVDPDDCTPAAIRATGAEIISYGAPTFPGAMFLLAWIGDIPILGLPGCVMYHKATIFDLIVPRILAGLEVSREDIAMLGHGGYCSGCGECRYPICSFGKN